MADKNIRTRKKSRLKRARLRLFSKIKHLVDEAHWKTAIHLCRRFDVILLPEFSTRDMMQKHGANGGWKRKISKKTCRNLAMWSHYKFRLRLIEKAKQYGRSLLIVGEEYTTQKLARLADFFTQKSAWPQQNIQMPKL